MKKSATLVAISILTPVAIAAPAMAGVLSFAVTPDIPNFSSVTLDGTAQTASVTLNNYEVSDDRGTGAGWNVTVQGTQIREYCPEVSGPCGSIGYVEGGKTFDLESLGLEAASSWSAVGSTSGGPPTNPSGAPYMVDGASATKVATAAINDALGTWRANQPANGVDLSISTTTFALASPKVYRTDVTWTLSSGP